MRCIPARQQHQEYILAQLELCNGEEAKVALMPYFAALLANICQVELQLGKNALYRQLLKAHVYEQGFQALIMISEVRF